MAPQVPESAQLAYSIDTLTVFEPSRAPLDPSGGEPDHPKALICWENGVVKFRFGGEINEIGRPRRPFYLHMSAIGWSDLPPAGLKGALEGPKSFKFLRYYRVIC